MSTTLNMSVIELVNNLAAPVFGAIPGLQAVYLFGSAAEGRLRSDSDIDLAVLTRVAIDPEAILTATEKCERLLSRDVDLVELRTAPLILQTQVVGRGRRLAGIGNSREAALFENLVMSRYLAFVEERRPLLENVVRRRSIHAA